MPDFMNITSPTPPVQEPVAGSGLATVILGMLATGALVLAAILSAKPLSIILLLWLIGGPAITLGIALVAMIARDTAQGCRAADTGHLTEAPETYV